MFKLLVLDVDGICTSGTKIYDNSGKAIAKSFCDLDFTAIKRFKQAGIEVIWLSGDSNVNKAVAIERNIDFWLSINYNKDVLIEEISKKYRVKLVDVAYVGDDWYDISTFKRVGYAYCSPNSPRCVKNVAKVIDGEPGNGLIAKLYDDTMTEEIKPNDI